MNWLTASALFVGVLIWLSGKAKKPKARQARKPEAPEVSRQERLRDAIGSGDLQKMEEILPELVSPLDRHELLSAVIKKTYALRSQPAMRARLYEFGQVYIGEFDRMAPLLQKSSQGRPVEAPAIKSLAIALEEDRKFDAAIDLCRKALAWGLDDGTKTGYEGRIRRIKKKQFA